ncbi:hypothetical protein NX773_13745 [Massilia solisilvae]|uniref:Uncharacterized protein n=1 Tax=Massilia solisilvae TaxID=1811225 RepID=A0ABT2BL93_9BURK|nr:hypothetical protein [Massilia solisilvae]MCS0609230.1 hypothetical protein [Massilia solisilvae]
MAIALNKYPVIPQSLRAVRHLNSAVTEIRVDLASLYHHYYLDSFGRTPPSPDPAQFEHIQFLLPTKDFRFQGAGLGIAPAIKKHRSNELGQAFCRWFLHEHFNITYFAHMEHVLDRQLHRAFDGCRVERISKGDAPDYFCAESVDRIFLAEAKGRHSPISFKNKEFNSWRQQFERVIFKDASGKPLSIKGHIVATRFITEHDSSKLRSGLWAEDPDSPGEQGDHFDTKPELGRAIITSHYSGIATKLNQPILATSLASGVPLPNEIIIQCVAWKVIVGPLQGKRFIGGYFGGPHGSMLARDAQGRYSFERHDPLRLDSPSVTFFGVEESIFRQVVLMARNGGGSAAQLRPFKPIEFFYSGFSILRDGSALAPAEFFVPVDMLAL